MIYADHAGIRTDAPQVSDQRVELFGEISEQACRRFAPGAAFCAVYDHVGSSTFEAAGPARRREISDALWTAGQATRGRA